MTFGGLPDDVKNDTVYKLDIIDNQSSLQWELPVMDVGYGNDSIKNSTADVASIDFTFGNIMLPYSEFDTIASRLIELGFKQHDGFLSSYEQCEVFYP